MFTRVSRHLPQACLLAEAKGKKLPFSGEEMDQRLALEERKPAEARTRRRSFLPWGPSSRGRGEGRISRSSETLDTDKTRKSSTMDAPLQVRPPV